MKKVFLFTSLFALIFIAILLIRASYKRSLPQGRVQIDGQEFNVDIADTVISRMRGLSGRKSLLSSEGMLFIFPIPAKYQFWMKDMKFSLDIIWIRDNRIIGLAENLPAPKSIFDIASTTPLEAVDKVLEVNAGTAEKYGFKAGDEVGINLSPSEIRE